MTLRQLYTQFGHDPKWQRFAVASTQPMVSVFLRKMGDRDVTSLSDFDLALQLAMSDQPEDRKVKAKACMRYMLQWAAAHGHTDIPSMEETEHTGTVPAVTVADVTEGLSPACSSLPKERKKKPAKSGEKKPKVTTSEKKVTTSRPKVTNSPKPTPQKRRVNRCTQQGDVQIPLPKTDTDTLTMEDWVLDTHWRTGNITPDNSSKGWKNGKRIYKDCWRATIQIRGVKYRYRAKTRQECKEWLKAVLSKKILPTDNKADWWRMEQRKDEAVRIDEIITNQAEESVMLYDYHQTHDLTAISEYVVGRLLPHMIYYCAHTLGIGQQRTQTASKQAIALLLTRIIQGRPVANFTNSCKRMLRTYRDRGDFFYYETNAPKNVQMMVNSIDFAPLQELYKITKDKRI